MNFKSVVFCSYFIVFLCQYSFAQIRPSFSGFTNPNASLQSNIATLNAPDDFSSNDQFGWETALSVDGTVMAVGAKLYESSGANKGGVVVYQKSGGSWSQIGSTIEGEADNDSSATSIALSGDGTRVAIGAPDNDVVGIRGNHGSVRVYDWNGSSWNKIGSDLDAAYDDIKWGWDLDLDSDGSHLVIGGYGSDGSSFRNIKNIGEAVVYTYSGGSWSQVGSDIYGESSQDRFGWSVSIDDAGDTIVVGAALNDGGGTNSGAAYVYDWNGNSWAQRGSDINGSADSDYFGVNNDISSDGNSIIVSAQYNDDGGSNAGEARIFIWDGVNWVQSAKINGTTANDILSGVSMSADGLRVVVGSCSSSTVGYVSAYYLNGNTWALKGTISATESGDYTGCFGSQISDDGNTITVTTYSTNVVKVYEWDDFN